MPSILFHNFERYPLEEVNSVFGKIESVKLLPEQDEESNRSGSVVAVQIEMSDRVYHISQNEI